jgi:hypothetical protein
LTGQDDPALAEARVHNLEKARFLIRLAWGIEIALVATGIGIALAQARSSGAVQDVATAFPVFGVFFILAIAELSKIPAAMVVFHARGFRKLLPGLVAGTAQSVRSRWSGRRDAGGASRKRRSPSVVLL